MLIDFQTKEIALIYALNYPSFRTSQVTAQHDYSQTEQAHHLREPLQGYPSTFYSVNTII